MIIDINITILTYISQEPRIYWLRCKSSYDLQNDYMTDKSLRGFARIAIASVKESCTMTYISKALQYTR
jgi:hypothetical protein